MCKAHLACVVTSMLLIGSLGACPQENFQKCAMRLDLKKMIAMLLAITMNNELRITTI